MFICAGESEQFDFAEPIGIGMIDAAINLTGICLNQKPDNLIFVGTAGTYGEHTVFDIIESKIATNIEIGFFEGQSYTPIENRVVNSEDVSRETVVNSSNYITIDEQAARQYIAQDIGLENMEFYAVLKVARRFNISAKGIFIVTNQCNARAHEDFLSHRAEAMERLTHYIRSHYA